MAWLPQSGIHHETVTKPQPTGREEISKAIGSGLEIKFFSQEVQNFKSKFDLTRSRKCIYGNGRKV